MKRICIGLAMLALSASTVLALQEYRNVKAEDLRDNPQNYWARGVVFQDELLPPPEIRYLRYEDKEYEPASTRVLGICYVSADIAPMARELPFNRLYIFKGTILQAQRQYYCVINGIAPASDIGEFDVNAQQQFTQAQAVPLDRGTSAMSVLLSEVQLALALYATNNNIALDELLTPDPENKKALGVIYETIGAQERELKTSATEMLATYILSFFRQNRPAQESGTPSPARKAASAPAPKSAEIPPDAPVGMTVVLRPPVPDVEAPAASPAPEQKRNSLWQRMFGSPDPAAAEKARLAREEKKLQKEEQQARREQQRKEKEALAAQQAAEKTAQQRKVADDRNQKRKEAEAGKDAERLARKEAARQQTEAKAETERLEAEKKALAERIAKARKEAEARAAKEPVEEISADEEPVIIIAAPPSATTNAPASAPPLELEEDVFAPVGF